MTGRRNRNRGIALPEILDAPLKRVSQAGAPLAVDWPSQSQPRHRLTRDLRRPAEKSIAGRRPAGGRKTKTFAYNKDSMLRCI